MLLVAPVTTGGGARLPHLLKEVEVTLHQLLREERCGGFGSSPPVAR